MAKCNFKLKSGNKCGTETEGQKRKCEYHRTDRCSVCDSPAWLECESADCEAVLCRHPTCKVTHEQTAHPDGIEKPDTPTEGQEAKPEAPDTIPVDALPCPACEGEPHAEMGLKGYGKGHRKKTCQVVCSKCRVAGPVAESLALAVRGWDRLPRGRPSIYEGIRTRSLALIDKALIVYEEALEDHQLTMEDCQAVAKMLEAATMAVDTWEM